MLDLVHPGAAPPDMGDPGGAALSLRVTRMEWAATDVLELELRDPGGADLPSYTPGAHLDLKLPNGLTRSYSLKGDPDRRDRYVVGVGLDAGSRGGSAYVHRTLRVGDMLPVAGPRNHFPLAEDAAQSVLIAGGIGVTPMVCMARRLAALGRPCRFHYAVRSADRAAFLDELRALPIELRLHIDAEAGGPLDLGEALAGVGAGAHAYCCGPKGMMAAFEAATADWDAGRVHVEYFTPKEIAPLPADEGGAVSVECRRSGKTVQVPAGLSIASALKSAGIRVETSCEDGICGTCETRVLDGVPLHRDSVLTRAEQDAGRSMMICVSRCRGDRLVLDI